MSVEGENIKVSGGKRYAWRYYLSDKRGCGYSVDHPSRFLSSRSMERRKRSHVKADSTDLPVSETYVRQLLPPGTTLLAKSKWNNTVVVGSQDSSLLVSLSSQSFVKRAEKVWQTPDSVKKKDDFRILVREDFQKWDSVRNDAYGMSRPQIEMLGGDRLHELGFEGRGVLLAILDGGFQNVDKIGCLQKADVTALRNFIPTFVRRGMQPSDLSNVYDGIDHGTKVFSVLAANAPEVMLGAARDASYMLFRPEDPDIEMPIEEDFWAMAAETADSLGVDVISSSLGYNEYDKDFSNYRLQDLDGHTSLISHTASLLARKGIVLCTSAGNSGMGAWKKLNVPGDAEDVITVGAVDSRQRIAPFSSVGPSQDGRVKPDVVALGAPTTLITGRGTLSRDMGTSFSTPIVAGLVACLWQGLPNKTALEIIDLVRRSSTLYDEPDNVYGYGIPDFWRAYMIGRNE